MARRKGQWALQRQPGDLDPSAAAFAAKLDGKDTFEWPAEPTEQVRIWGVTDGPYVVDVELVRDSEGEVVPVGVAVRRAFPTSRHRKGANYPVAEGTVPAPVSAVDVRGVPFGRVIRAALTAAREPGTIETDELDRILVPRGRPQRGRSVKFYRELLDAARDYEKRGLSPAKEIARRKGVSENLVHQWLYVARHRYRRDGE
jgi:hypothetical protein